MGPRKRSSRDVVRSDRRPLLLASTRLRSAPYDNFPVGGTTEVVGNSQPQIDGKPQYRLWYSPAGRIPWAVLRPDTRRR
jgi:hypothetical protein